MTRIALLSCVLIGCGGSLEGGPSDASGDGAPTEEQVRQQFAEVVAPILATNCDTCHATGVSNAPIFESTYESVTTHTPKLLSCARPAESLLISIGPHTGPAFPDADKPEVQAWIEQWALASPECMVTAAASTGQFVPTVGPNTVSLANLGPGLEGATLTFNLERVGSTDLYLSLITLNAGPNGLHVRGPQFEMCVGVTSVKEARNTFGDLDITIPANMSASMSPGTLELVDVPMPAEFAVRFVEITPEAGSMGEPVDNGGACE